MRITLPILLILLFILPANAQQNPIFAGGNGSGTAYQCHVQPNNNGIFGGGSDLGLFADCTIERSAMFSGTVFLQGAYDPNSGLMRDDLREQGLLPTNEPYSALGFIDPNGAAVDSALFDSTGSKAIVDWVLLDLRNVSDSSVIDQSFTALLLADGSIVDIDGSSPVQRKIFNDSAYISIVHRNHLGAMLNEAIDLTASDTILINMSDTSVVKYGVEPMATASGIDLLWAGNVNLVGGSIKYTGADNDRDPILVKIGGNSPTNIVQAYSLADVNLDGMVKYTGAENDRDIILVNIGGSSPTNIRAEQLPQ